MSIELCILYTQILSEAIVENKSSYPSTSTSASINFQYLC